MFLLQQETMHYGNLVVCSSSNLLRLAQKISLIPPTYLDQTENGHSACKKNFFSRKKAKIMNDIKPHKLCYSVKHTMFDLEFELYEIQAQKNI